MLTVGGQIEVRCTVEDAWRLFSRFDDLARLIPSVQDVQVHGDRVLARVAVKLGALPVSSRVVIEVTERKPLACLKAIGVSYLGETIVEQVAGRDLREIDADSVGRIALHLDLRPAASDGEILVIYEAGVEAEGRLKRIYQSILKTKAPAMMQEFADNIRKRLEQDAAPGPAPALAPAPAPAPALAPAPAPAPAPALALAPAPAPALALAPTENQPCVLGWWARLVQWLRRLVAGREDSEPPGT